MKYLITGANGFIGANLTRKLASEDKDVFAVVSPQSNLWRIKDLKTVKVVRCDLTIEEQVSEVLDKIKPNYIAHLATFGVYSYQQEDSERILFGNWNMAASLLETATSLKNLERFINFGTVFEYGTKEGKVKEEDVDVADILNVYSATKIATTALAASFFDKLPVVTLRPFTTYGPYEDKARFIAATILRGLKGSDIKIAPGVVRDFIFAEDVADAILRAFVLKKAIGQVINVGSGQKYTLEKVAEQIKDLTGGGSRIVKDPSYKREKDSRCWADIGKANELLGWSPKHSIEEGLEETTDWYRRSLNKLP